MVILITGGSGFFGRNYANHLLKKPGITKIIIYSRDEHKQEQMKHDFKNHQKLRYFIGDVRDQSRLEYAFNGVDIVIHAAAMKSVPACEYNPSEAIKTNIDGTKCVVRSICKSDVKKAIFISTDKAVNPVNLYGATKMVAEKYWIHSNVYKKAFMAVRLGNVTGSTGSVLNVWMKELENNIPLTITDPNMTRFWLAADDVVKFVFDVPFEPGIIAIPHMQSYYIRDLAKAFSSESGIEIIGRRKGEKMHETIINEFESVKVETGTMLGVGYYKIPPELNVKAYHPFNKEVTSLQAENISVDKLDKLLWKNQIIKK